MEANHVITLFGLLLSIIGWFIVDVLKGIRAELKAVNQKMDKIETDLHKRVSDIDRRHEERYVSLDRRVSTIEGHCAAVHAP
jgi:hypothetical protein